jgi:hypothetical protein
MGAGGRSFLMFAFLLTFLAAGAGVQAACNQAYSGSGDWIISTAVVCNDTFVDLAGNLIIQPSGSLVLGNVTLDVVPGFGEDLAVNNSGILIIHRSRILNTPGTNHHIYSNIGSSLVIDASVIDYIFGIIIYSDSAVIRNSNITRLLGTQFHSSGNLIEGCNISEGTLYLEGSSNTIRNTVISDNMGIMLNGSYNTFSGNTINNSVELMVLGNGNMILNCTFDEGLAGLNLAGNNNLVDGITVSNSLSAVFSSGRNNTFSNSVFSSNPIGAYIINSDDAKMSKCVFQNNTLYDIELESVRFSSFSLNNYTTLHKSWNLSVSALSSNGSAVSGASVVISNRTGAVVNTQTGSDGKTPWFTVTEYYENSGNITSANPYTISVTKTGVSPGSAVINITSDTTVNITMGAQQLTPFNLVVESPANKTYMENDPELVNTSFLLAAVTSNLNMTSCRFTIRSYTEDMESTNNKTFTGYLSIFGYGGQYTMSFACTSQDGRTGTADVQFMVYSTYTCLQNADCADDEACVSNDCSELNCGCGYPSNHACVQYRCCENAQCNESDYCDMGVHECRRVECTCGSIADHQCTRATGYCCEDTHCGENQICKKDQHQCVTKTLNVVTEGDPFIGHTVKVYVFDQDNKSVQDVGITIVYQDTGKSEIFFTNTQKDGRYYAEIPITEQGMFQITARKAGFETQKVIQQASYDYFSVILPALIIIIIVPVVLFFFKTHKKSHVEDVSLSLDKDMNGQEVRLKIKNRSSKTLENLEVTDQVPVDSFIWSAMMPKITMKNSITDFLTWEILRLQPGEEVVIAYRTNKALSGFIVKVDGKEYKK